MPEHRFPDLLRRFGKMPDSKLNQIRLHVLPADGERRRIVSVGPVRREGQLPQEPHWKVSWERLTTDSHSDADQEPEEQRNFEAHWLGAGLLKDLAIASLWEGDTLTKPNDPKRARSLHISTKGQRLWQRLANDSRKTPRFSPYRPEVDAPPYLYLPIGQNYYADYALIRCSEIIRFYFAQVSKISSYLFDFDSDCNNPALYSAKMSGWNPNGQYAIAPTSLLTNNDAAVLAILLATPASRKALVMAARSARQAMLKNRPVWPVTYVPVEGDIIWRIIGQDTPWTIINADTGEQEQAIGISQIVTCYAPIPIKNVQVIRSTSRIEADDVPPSQIHIPGGNRLAAAASLRSDEPASISADQFVDIRNSLADSRPAAAKIKARITYRKERGDSTRIAPSGATQETSTLTTLEGTGGSLSTGSYRSSAAVPTVADINDASDQQEEDRENLPSLFSDYPDVSPTIDMTPIAQAPSSFQNLIEGERHLADNLPREASSTFIGLPPGTTFADAIPLLQLPKEWGQYVECARSPTGMRRAIALQIATDTWQCLFFDIERRYETEPIGIHCMFFPFSRPLPMPVLGKIFRSRLAGDGWPMRETHNGNFLTEKMQHTRKAPVAKRSSALIQKHLGHMLYRVQHSESG